ncbi:MAG: CDGSH iron-sulfur domain-containing protein [Bacteroidota bacterium]
MSDDVRTLTMKAGETYALCRCGRSGKLPHCDGSHAGTTVTPMIFKPGADMNARFCACGKTKKPPFCDGSHLD